MTGKAKTFECLGQTDEFTAGVLTNLVWLKSGASGRLTPEQIGERVNEGLADFGNMYGSDAKAEALNRCADKIAADECPSWRFDSGTNQLI